MATLCTIVLNKLKFTIKLTVGNNRGFGHLMRHTYVTFVAKELKVLFVTEVGISSYSSLSKDNAPL